MTAASLDAWVAARRADLDRLFETRLAAPADGDPGRLLEAMRYSLLAPGKRIRPLLALAAAETSVPPDSDGLLRTRCQLHPAHLSRNHTLIRAPGGARNACYR